MAFGTTFEEIGLYINVNPLAKAWYGASLVVCIVDVWLCVKSPSGQLAHNAWGNFSICVGPQRCDQKKGGQPRSRNMLLFFS